MTPDPPSPHSVTGLWYEDLAVGLVIRHAVTRTVTEVDNLLITSLTMNVQPLHLDAEFAAGTLYGQRIVNSVFTLGLVTGIPVQDVTLGTTLGNLGFRDITFPRPVFHGDTLHVETEVLDARLSRSRPGTGIVGLEHRGFNQRDELVCRVRRDALMLCRPADVPPRDTPPRDTPPRDTPPRDAPPAQ